MNAHTPNANGKWHDLREHLERVAELCEQFANRLGIQNIGYVAGILHDLGKCHPEFQAYLEQPTMKRKVRDHSSAGAVYAMNQYSFYGVLLAWIVAGHHSGLANRSRLSVRLLDKLEDEHVNRALKGAESHLQGVLERMPVLPDELPEGAQHLSQPQSIEVWLRMLFSCLVDADYLDTESHFIPENEGLRSTWQAELTQLWNRFAHTQERFQASVPITPLNSARRSVYQQCVQASERESGIFSLNVPTGLGKTLASMGFALRHAALQQKERVIVAVPYSSILDQNARVYKSILGDQAVLEHHSAMEILEETEQESRRKLATENWDAPVIVTTTVQLFESLFARRPSALRKLHHIANSVVILDEVQMLPLELLQPIFSMMRELTLHYNITFLLSSATPLALDLAISSAGENLPSAVDLVPDAKELFVRFKRVTYDLSPLSESWTWEQVAARMREQEQVMVIVNRRKDAVELFDQLAGDPAAVHLSASMCQAHRKQVLQEVHESLQTGKPVRLVATQVVEAGVDLDFPVVMRAAGPLDRIVQAAGRCNREGKLESGTTVVFVPEDGGLPTGSYRTMTELALNYLTRDQDCLHRLETFEKYFRQVYTVVGTDGRGVEALRRCHESPCQFEEVERRFRMIDAETVSVLVLFDREAEKLEEEAEYSESLSRSWMRRAQMYTVNLYHNSQFLREEAANLRAIGDGWYVWTGRYHEQKGLVAGMKYEAEQLMA